MSPFPPSSQVQFLLEGNAWIIQITFHATTMAFQFANGCKIEVGGTLTYVSSDGIKVVHDKEWFRESPVLFHILLDKRLVAVDAEDLEMTLTFENGSQLIVHSEIGP